MLYILGGGGGGGNAFMNNLDIAESSSRDDVVHRSTLCHDVPKFFRFKLEYVTRVSLPETFNFAKL